MRFVLSRYRALVDASSGKVLSRSSEVTVPLPPSGDLGALVTMSTKAALSQLLPDFSLQLGDLGVSELFDPSAETVWDLDSLPEPSQGQ